jgi:hypothetical protein
MKGKVRKVMRKIAVAVGVVASFAGLAAAQIPTSGNVFFGYSYYTTNLSSIDRANTNGWEASVEGKLIPWVGIVADFDSHYGSQNFVGSCVAPVPSGPCPFSADVTEHNFLFGPRVSFSIGRFRPYAEGMIGAAHVSVNNGVGSDTSFASALGGGLDYKIIKLIAWRFQGDYINTRFFSTSQNNLRISTGIVARF